MGAVVFFVRALGAQTVQERGWGEGARLLANKLGVSSGARRGRGGDLCSCRFSMDEDGGRWEQRQSRGCRWGPRRGEWANGECGGRAHRGAGCSTGKEGARVRARCGGKLLGARAGGGVAGGGPVFPRGCCLASKEGGPWCLLEGLKGAVWWRQHAGKCVRRAGLVWGRGEQGGGGALYLERTAGGGGGGGETTKTGQGGGAVLLRGAE